MQTSLSLSLCSWICQCNIYTRLKLLLGWVAMYTDEYVQTMSILLMCCRTQSTSKFWRQLSTYQVEVCWYCEHFFYIIGKCMHIRTYAVLCPAGIEFCPVRSVCISLLTEGVGCLDIQLSDEPNLGRWTASASLIIVSLPPTHTHPHTHTHWQYCIHTPWKQSWAITAQSDVCPTGDYSDLHIMLGQWCIGWLPVCVCVYIGSWGGPVSVLL